MAINDYETRFRMLVKIEKALAVRGHGCLAGLGVVRGDCRPRTWPTFEERPQATASMMRRGDEEALP